MKTALIAHTLHAKFHGHVAQLGVERDKTKRRPWEYAMLVHLDNDDACCNHYCGLPGRDRVAPIDSAERLNKCDGKVPDMVQQLDQSGLNQAAKILRSLQEKSGLILYPKVVKKHRKLKLLVLINGDPTELVKTHDQLVTEQWLEAGGFGNLHLLVDSIDMNDLDAVYDHFTPAARLRLLHEMIKLCVYESESDGHLETILVSPYVDQVYPLHDFDASGKLLHKFFSKNDSWYDSFAMSDEDFDEIRNLFGDEIAFYYAWLSHYTNFVVYLAVVGIVIGLICAASNDQQAKKVKNVWSLIVIIWITVYHRKWAMRREFLKLRWQLWNVSTATARREFIPWWRFRERWFQRKKGSKQDSKQDAEVDSFEQSYYPNSLRFLSGGLLIPAMIFVLAILTAFVVFIFWLELHIIFDWGKCRQINKSLKFDKPNIKPEDLCLDSLKTHGAAGWFAELSPGLLEALFFELMLLVFAAVVKFVCKLQNWRTEQDFESAFIYQIWVLEYIGMFCWYFLLAFYFVPQYNHPCADVDRIAGDAFREYVDAENITKVTPMLKSQFQANWTMTEGVKWEGRTQFNTSCFQCSQSVGYSTFGENHLDCIKDQAGYDLRYKAMEAYMVSPFLVNQLLNCVFKAVLPKYVHANLKRQREELTGMARWCAGMCTMMGLLLGHEARRPDGETYTSCKLPACPGITPAKSTPTLAALEDKAGNSNSGVEAAGTSTSVCEKGSEDGGIGGVDSGSGGPIRTYVSHRIHALVGRESRRLHPPYDTIEQVIDESTRWDTELYTEYLEIVLQMCWVAYFSVIFPWGPACVVLNNYIEIRSDTMKFLRCNKRPVPKRVDGIGSWEAIIAWVAWSAVVVNLAMCILSMNSYRVWMPSHNNISLATYWKEALLVIFVGERFLLFVIHLLKEASPQKSRRVQIEEQKEQHSVKKAFLEHLHSMKNVVASSVESTVGNSVEYFNRDQLQLKERLNISKKGK